MTTLHNIQGHGYGVQRTVQASVRIKATHNKPTGLGALLNPTPAQVIQAEVNRREGIPDNWHITPGDASHSEHATWKDDAAGRYYERKLATTQGTRCPEPVVAEEEPISEAEERLIQTWIAAASAAADPVKFVMCNVPRRYKAAVIAAAR
jgi:hypothetical protein